MTPRPALIALLALLGPAAVVAAAAAETDAVKRGKYVFDAAGCAGCHTDIKNKGPFLAGGRALKTPFGTYYSPNITPHPERGIGTWSARDFRRALRQGLSPDGDNYFPVFPYGSYTRMTDTDIDDLWAYLSQVPPVARANRPHAAKPPFGWRFLVSAWKALYFTPGAYRSDGGRSNQWNRGAYVVRALVHCAECHTPRDFLGGFEKDMELAGTANGPWGGVIPNITADRETGIGKWSEADLKELFTSGMLPDGDFIGGAMGEVVDNSTSRLSDADLKALITYVRSLPAVSHKVAKPKPPTKEEDW